MFEFNIQRILAVAERDLRRFRRNTKLMIPMALMPIIYLVILGKSMGGDLHDLPMAVVVQDHGRAAEAVTDRLLTMEESRRLFKLSTEPDPETAVEKLRQGRYKAVVIVPPSFSEDLARGDAGELGVVVDNTDNTSANIIEAEVRRAFGSLSGNTTASNSKKVGVQVQRVDVYGHKEFMQYLVPAVIALALFFVAMLAGGIILVDDRARGIHEGYFVTPLTALDLVGGLTLSATTLAMIIGTTVLISALVIAQLPLLNPVRTVLLTGTAILLLAVGLILFMFTLMARVSNPLTPRALFGILNVLTFFPSGALYPTESYPAWLNAISVVFPMRYAVHALRNLLLKGVGFGAVAPDFLAMGVFAAVMLVLACTLFKRTL
ncbi:MAG TPA: ABC transporter permease [Candidatus Eisenbacteria bacterium]|nr:ABC transporter permease [Candidatus Eisenbacteria bacterium]